VAIPERSQTFGVLSWARRSTFYGRKIAMPAKGDDEPLRKVIGSTGQKNQAIKNYLRKLFRRKGSAPPPKV